MFIVIGISGKIGTGKSTISETLYRMGKAQAWRDFGDAVKEDCSERFGFPLEWAYSAEGKERVIFHSDLPLGSMRVRHILQWWGTDVCRKQDPHHWVKKMNSWITVNRPNSLILGDIRFMEEAEYILHMGGWLFRLEPYPEYRNPPGGMHTSEMDLDEFSGWHGRYRPSFGYKHLHAVAREIAQIVP